MTITKNIIIVTGGNGGIGFEVASQLMANEVNHVIIGSRSVEKGEAAMKDLQSKDHPGSVEMVQLDVTSHDSITAAAEKVEATHGKIDVVVNNAGIAAVGSGPPPGHVKFVEGLTTNVVGPYMMVNAFEPLLKKSDRIARIVNVTGGAGSIATCLKPDAPADVTDIRIYRCSKAALNMLTACQAVQFGKLGWKVFTVCPGLTVSHLSEFNAEQYGAKPTSHGAAVIVRVVNGERDDEHGCFLKEDGQYPW